jgi:hypothetical protein
LFTGGNLSLEPIARARSRPALDDVVVPSFFPSPFVKAKLIKMEILAVLSRRVTSKSFFFLRLLKAFFFSFRFYCFTSPHSRPCSTSQTSIALNNPITFRLVP